ncbi:GFA family protein [Asticcacaulis sp. YBE204]|uniref:GFA family protein n=1 Tax=Asticcacaulis sp. YBE204 TaxID=1282363 RepID=UPI0003C3DAE4|nr:GFA family protein [Asticcacaulis sp. YBE204]ESQ81152.1 hypothetical protein AEYBE204_02120 [Asticcacaulis sp. YBE204]
MTIHQGSCHCGKIAFEVEGDFSEGLDCNCSLCRRRGGLLSFISRDAFRLNSSRDDLSMYQFNHHVLNHYFCSTCGIAPFSEGKNRDGSEMTAVNLRCMPDIDLDALKITKWDGASK